MSKRLLLIAPVLVGLAACGGSDSSSTGGGSAASSRPAVSSGGGQPSRPTVTLKGHIDLTQPAKTGADFSVTEKDVASCDDYAKYGENGPLGPGDTPRPMGQQFSIPGSDKATTGDGKKMGFALGSLDNYHGAGDYTLKGSPNQGLGSLWLDGFNSDQEPAEGPENAVITVTVKGDGGGSAEFSNFIDPGSHNWAGKVMWTCSQG